ncbi:MAG: antitoxin family protein [Gemmataceae bacterium]|nr:antitoxin family protein [Gemmataceae bacterium]
MGLDIEAIYENGTLKLPRPLPLAEGATIRITIHPPGRVGVVIHNRSPWTGSREELERLALDPELGLEGTS